MDNGPRHFLRILGKPKKHKPTSTFTKILLVSEGLAQDRIGALLTFDFGIQGEIELRALRDTALETLMETELKLSLFPIRCGLVHPAKLHS